MLTTIPGGIFTASVLFDLLALIADGPEQARTYRTRATDLLRLGVGSALSSLALEAADFLHAPPGQAGSAQGRKFSLTGTLIAIYLLDLAARQIQVTGARDADPRTDVLPAGLSLLGLAVVGIAGRLK
jgi:hypothetical protein